MHRRVLIYTSAFCPWCARARQLLLDRGLDFDEVDVTSDAATRERLVELTGQRTVPQIFIDDTSIGGFEELQTLDRSGRLTRLVAV